MDRDSALRHAVDLLLSPQEERFQRYLDICDDVHACDGSGNTLLHWAAALGNFGAAYALLQRGVDVDACNTYGATPLCVAAAICPNVATLGFLLVSHGASLQPRAKGAEGNGMSIQLLLEARELGHVWRWLVDTQQTGSADGELNVNSFRGSRELPTKSEVVANVLCPPRELERLRKAVSQAGVNGGGGCSGGPSSCASAAAAVAPVPHPPPRDHRAISRTAAAGERTPEHYPASSRPLRGDDVAAIAHALLLQVELLLSQESAARLAVEKDQVESFLELYAATTVLLDDWCDEEREEDMDGEDEDETSEWGVPHGGALEDSKGPSSISSRSGALGLVGSIQSVLGERIDADGRHHLLVQYRDPTAEEGHSEAWQLADAVMADPVVHAHLARSYSGNVSVDTSEVKTPSIMTLANAGSPLDTWEREQLEAQLRLLPRRFLQSHEGGSPLYPQSLSTFLASPNGTFPAAKHGASPIMSNFVFSEQFRPRSSDSNSSAHHHSTSAAAYEVPSRMSDQLQPHEQRASWRFAAGHPQQFTALMNEAEPREETNPATRQLLLSDRWSTQNHLAEVLLDDAGSSIHTAIPARQTPTPASMRNTFSGVSDVSDDTLASLTPAPSSAATKAPTTYSSSTANASSPRETNTRLTASQKVDYDAFLYGSALRLLDQKRHRRRTSAGREHLL